MDGIILQNIDNDHVNILISKKKYKLLDKINDIHMPFIVDEIFELGYSMYIKNLIKSDLNNETNTTSATNGINNLEERNKITNGITESKYSTIKGSLGENVVMDILIDKFPNYLVENMSKVPHSGDIQLTLPTGIKIIVEVKNYNKTIDQEQIDKLKFDMRFNNIKGALFVSLNSGIVGKKKFELEFFKNNADDYFIIYFPYSMHKSIPDKKNIISHNSIEDSISNLSIKLEFGICVVQNIITKLNSNSTYTLNKFFSNVELDWMTTQFNSLYSEFRDVKNSIRKLEESFKKSLDSHKSVISNYENSILNKINHLVGTKLYTLQYLNIDKKNIELEKNDFGSWDILINKKIYGKIVFVERCYDILIVIDNNNIINKQFVNFVECLNYIDQI